MSLFPENVAEMLSGRGHPSLVVVAEEAAVRLELRKGTRLIASEPINPTEAPTREIERFLAAYGLKSNSLAIGLRLPEEEVFARELVLPAQALGAIDTIVAQDLANKTPFKAEDIYSDYVATEQVDGKLAIRQWIARRQSVDQALLSLQIDVERISFISFGAADREQPASVINLQKGAHHHVSWAKRAAIGLCCSAVVLEFLAGGVRYWRQQQSIDRLEAEIAAVGGKAKQVRTLIEDLKEKKDALVQLRLRRSEHPGLIDLWEETTRILPSHSWLTEFRVSEAAEKQDQQISVVGFSSEAPSLVGIVDGSPLFRDAALTSAIAFDAAEGRERFALQAMVRTRAALKEAAGK
ncbi:MAG TPA: PilN domain-containing protein [Bradyrhizobium sp.]|nr:PilN domain-containing protein [Bradyrhizobium sp.]